MQFITRIFRYSKIYKYLRNNAVTTNSHTKTSLTLEDIPHPRSLPILGTKLSLFASGGGTMLHEYIDLRHKQFGSIFYENLSGSTGLVFISDPALMKTLFLNLEGKYPGHILPDPWVLYEKLYGSKRGLFFMNGEEWLVNRRIMNKHVLREDAEKWLETPIKETIDEFTANWKEKAKQQDFTPNLESEFYKLSTNVIIKVLLGENSSLKPNKHTEILLEMFSETVKKIFQTTTKLYGLPVHWCHRLNLKVWRDFMDCVDMSLSLAQKLVNEMLTKRHENNGLIGRLCGENLSNEAITRIVADFVIAAGDTTAYTSLWILYLLSKNEEVVKEIRMRDITYIKYVIKESMRLYPVAPFLTRILPNESIVGPYKLDAGTPVIASIYTSGRDEHNFSKADKFLPYRWDRNDSRKRDLLNHVPSASLPFALGARSCIGKKIAMLQITEFINQVVKNFDIQCMNNMEVNAITSQVLVPNKHIELSFSLYKSESKED